MGELFDSKEIAKRGWRQGAVLGGALATLAGEHAPRKMPVDSADWLVLTSHDCDIVNASIDKEPVVEVLRMKIDAAGKVNKQQWWGRNPRALQLTIEVHDHPHTDRSLSAGKGLTFSPLTQGKSGRRDVVLKSLPGSG